MKHNIQKYNMTEVRMKAQAYWDLKDTYSIEELSIVLSINKKDIIDMEYTMNTYGIVTFRSRYYLDSE